MLIRQLTSRAAATVVALLLGTASFSHPAVASVSPTSGTTATRRTALAPYQVALRNARIPASCGHAATHLSGYTAHWGMEGDAKLEVRRAVRGHLKHRHGAVTVVPLSCNAGGVIWPEYVLIYGAHARLIGTVSLGEIPSAQEQMSAKRFRFIRGEVRFRFVGYDGGMVIPTVSRGRIGWSHQRRTWHYVAPLVITGDVIDGDFAPTVSGPSQAQYLAPVPRALVRFMRHRWAVLERYNPESICGQPASVALTRYSHLGFADAAESACTGENAVYARIHGRWKKIYAWQDSPECSSMSPRLSRAFRVLGRSCYRGTRLVALGHWPASGI